MAMRTPASDQPDAAALLRVLDLARRLAVPCDLQPLLALIIDVGREVLGADRGTVFLYDAEARELYATVATGEQSIRFGIDTGIAGECARRRRVVNVPDCYADPRFNRDIDRRTGYRTRSLLAVPLIGLEDELVGVIQILNPARPAFDAADERIAETLAAQAAVAIQRARLIEDRITRLKLEADLDLARQIQMDVLPRALPACAGYDLAHFSRPADQTGGDIYDVVELPDTDADAPALLLLLADATGHGIGPALSVTQARSMLRMALRYSTDLDLLLHHINAQLEHDLAGNRFITAFMGVLDPRNHRVVYHAPGQGPLLHLRAAGPELRWLDASTVPLGILDELPLEPIDPIELGARDVLVLLTDGFYEYQDAGGEQFGRDRVGQVVLEHRAGPAAAIVERLLAALQAFAGSAPQQDDLTALVVRRVGDGA